MNLIKYVWRNVTRNKLRSVLTMLSICFSMALMTVLQGYMAMQDAWESQAEKYNRIVVMNKQGFSGLLPISYVDDVAEVEGVKAATPYAWYGGNYKEEQMPFAQFATDPKTVFKVWEEFTIDPQILEEWQDNRRGCVVDRRLAARRGWKKGEKIPLKGTFYQFDLDLELVGTFDSPTNTDSLWFNWSYLDEGLKSKGAPLTGNSGTIFAKTVSKEAIAKVSKAIDDRFASSDNPTRTQSEAAFAQMFADMIGNIRFYIFLIGMVIVIALSLVAANAMAMSMRERTTEIAVLKAIGFTRVRVMSMVLGEACMISLLGGLLGVLLGCACLQLLHGMSAQFFPIPIVEMIGLWLGYLLIAAAGIGLISGIIPAVRAAQLSVVSGLRRVV
jgi:putative ABC transport system permease protein